MGNDMDISITKGELLEYHSKTYRASDEFENIKEYVNDNGTRALLFNAEGYIDANDDDIQKDINEIEFDSETIERRVEENRAAMMEDYRVQEYLNAQRIHKANFLNEIHQKGLVLKKSDKSHASKQSRPPDRQLQGHLNY